TATQRLQRALANIDAPNGVTLRHGREPLFRYRCDPIARARGLPQLLKLYARTHQQSIAPLTVVRMRRPLPQQTILQDLTKQRECQARINPLSERRSVDFILLLVFELGSK